MARLYSTGEFAKLCGVKKQTLFHYDEIGLLKPAQVDERGFRQYAHSQYADFLMISCLKEAGMSLREIAAYLSCDDSEKRHETLKACIESLDARIAYLTQVRKVLDSSFGASAPSDRPAEQDKETRLLFQDPKEMWATPRLDILDDQQLVETVASIVKEVRPTTVCLAASDVQTGCLDTQRYLLAEQDSVGGAETASRLGLFPYTVPGGRYAQIDLYPDEDPELVYKRLLDDIALIDCHTGDMFYETVPEDADNGFPTTVSVEIFLNEDSSEQDEEID